MLCNFGLTHIFNYQEVIGGTWRIRRVSTSRTSPDFIGIKRRNSLYRNESRTVRT